MILFFFKRIMILLSFLSILIPCQLNAENDLSGEYYVKAAFIYNFAKFIEWPEASFATPTAPLTLCILGKDPFGSTIETIQGKNVRAHDLNIEYIDDLRSIKNCHILFICSSEKGNLKEILSKIKGLPILSVSDMDGFSNQGGMIHFFRIGNSIRFKINADAAKRAHIKISSQLLKLAEIVKENP